jgi:NADPH:quinone reductase-like Zn-dependent oxidoreductase
MKTFVLALSILASAPAFAARQVVMEKIDTGYRWKITEVSIPTPGDHQVLVRVHAAALNRSDLDHLESPSERDYSNRMPLSDAAGEVVAVGKQVKALRKGVRVTNTYFKDWVDGPYAEKRLANSSGWQADGVLADYVLLAETDVVPFPDHLSYEEAATLPTAGLTAWNAVNAHPTFKRGDVVLVQGTGGVSTFALQFAAAKGARVIVTSSSDQKLQRAQSLGAQDGINYKTQAQWSDAVLKLTNDHGADLVIDVGGKNTLDTSVKSLADAGTVVIVGGLSGYDGSLSAWGLLKKDARAQSVFVGSRADFLRMNAFISEHRLKPVIDRVYPLEQFTDALKHLASGNFVGKIVLRLQ